MNQRPIREMAERFGLSMMYSGDVIEFSRDGILVLALNVRHNTYEGGGVRGKCSSWWDAIELADVFFRFGLARRAVCADW